MLHRHAGLHRYFFVCRSRVESRWKQWEWLRAYGPGPVTVDGKERLRACCGALLGVLLTGLATHLLLGSAAALPFLIAPMGASAILLFAVPASPLAQPWALIGGNLVSAAVGVTCAHWIADPFFACSIALGFSIAAMFALRCLHPPSGAVALMAVLGGDAIHMLSYEFLVAPVAVNSLLLLSVAIVFNNSTRRRYPHPPHLHHVTTHDTTDARPTDRLGFTPDDLDQVLKHYNQVLDVSLDDLESLFLQAEMQAYRRRYGEITGADIMSRDIVTVEYGTLLEEAWTLLRRHRIKALPVIDRARRVIGILTLADFMKHADLDLHHTFEDKLRRLVRRTPHTHSDKPEVVGQLMTAPVRTIAATTHIVELVPLLSDAGMHHVPIVDGERRLVGMVTHSDIIAGLYRGRLTETAIAA
jgi:CBS domain-containing membrane protein